MRSSKMRGSKSKSKSKNKRKDEAPTNSIKHHDINKVSELIEPQSNLDRPMPKPHVIKQAFQQPEEQIGNKFAGNVESILETDLACKREPEWLVDESHGDNILVSSPDGRLLSFDSRSSKVSWSVSNCKALNASYLSPENVQIFRFLRNGYYYSEQADLECNNRDFLENPYEFVIGDIEVSNSVTKEYSIPRKGRRLSPLTSDGVQKLEATRDFSSDIFLCVKQFNCQLTCYKPGTDSVLLYLRITKFTVSIFSRDGASLREKNDVHARQGQTLIKPGTIGKISRSDRIIGEGGKDTVLVEGEYQQRALIVPIEKGQSDDDAVKKEVSIVSDVCDVSHNFVKVYGVESDRDFNYVATEYCDTSLREFIPLFCNSKSQHLKDHNKLFELIWGIVTALTCLHYNGISHGNLHINSIFVDKYSRAKISVIGKGWRIKFPSRDGFSLSKEATDDMLALGHVMFFCFIGVEYQDEDLTQPKPKKWGKSKRYLKPLYDCPEALDLLKKLLDKCQAQRLTAEEVYNHPLFWDSDKILLFIRDVSDRLEVEWNTKLSAAIENLGNAVFDYRWNKKLDPRFLKAMRTYKKYDYSNLYDLLRIIRNPYSHYSNLTQEIRGILGPIPTGFVSYFCERFPRLVIEVHNVMKGHCGNETPFQKYFQQSPL